MNVLLSIKPVHADNILGGIKRYEFRRKIFARTDVTTVIMYATRPVAQIVGEFDIEGIVSGHPDQVWMRTSEWSGISKSYFKEYFAGRTLAFALRVGQVRAFCEPFPPRDLFDDFTPPQSYCYVPSRYSEKLAGKQRTESFAW